MSDSDLPQEDLDRPMTLREGQALRDAITQEARSTLATLRSYRIEQYQPSTAQRTIVWFGRAAIILGLAAALVFEFLQSQDLHNKLVINCEKGRVSAQQQIDVDRALATQVLRTLPGKAPNDFQIKTAHIFSQAAHNIRLADCSVYQ